MWFTYLYSSLIPIGGIITAVGLCLYYWVDKYNLLRRASVPSNIAGELSIDAMSLLDFILILKPTGELIFDFQLRDSAQISSVIMLILGIIYVLLPKNEMLQYFHEEKFRNEEKKYSEVEFLFKETYQTLHPIYSFKKENQDRITTNFQIVESILTGIANIPLNKEIEQNSWTDIVSPDRLKEAAGDLKSLVRHIIPQSRRSNRVSIKE